MGGTMFEKMKRFEKILGRVIIPLTVAAGVILLSGTAPVGAQQTGPVQLVFLAFQGGLQEQGVPRAGALLRGVRLGRITSEQVVSAGIEAGRIPPSTLNDRAYLRTVESELEDLQRDRFDVN